MVIVNFIVYSQTSGQTCQTSTLRICVMVVKLKQLITPSLNVLALNQVDEDASLIEESLISRNFPSNGCQWKRSVTPIVHLSTHLVLGLSYNLSNFVYIEFLAFSKSIRLKPNSEKEYTVIPAVGFSKVIRVHTFFRRYSLRWVKSQMTQRTLWTMERSVHRQASK
jgi:hypothetical protein